MSVPTSIYRRVVTHADRLLRLARSWGVIRSNALAPLDIPRQTLARLHRRGLLERVGRGLYVLADANVTEHHTLAEASRRVPHGVIGFDAEALWHYAAVCRVTTVMRPYLEALV